MFPSIYYAAYHLTRIIDWCRHGRTKQWLYLEQAFTSIPLTLSCCQDNVPTSVKTPLSVHMGFV